jgi:hypothetical protein
VPTSRLTTETAQSINDLFNANVRQIWGAGNWPDLTGWGEARFAGDLLTYPNDLSKTAYWTATNVTVTANSISNPADNRVTASKVLETSSPNEHTVSQVISAFGTTTYQASVYARPAGRNWLYLVVNDGTTNFSCFYNVQTGVTGTQANILNANVTQCANGFFLCTMIYQTGANATSQTFLAGVSNNDNTYFYTGDPTKGLYLWGNLLVQQNNVSPQQFIIPWDQTGEAEIDVMFQAWVDSPAMITYPRQQGFIVTKDGFQMISSAGGFMGTNGYVTYNTNPANPIYIYYRRVPYNYSGSEYSASATYVAGQYIYYTKTTGASTGTSDYYKCLATTSAGESPETASSKWDIQPVPEMISQPLIWQTYGDWLIQDGQADKAAQAYGIVEMKKNEEWDRIQRQMPDSFQMTVSTHVTSQNRSW